MKEIIGFEAFEQALKENKICLIAFMADWCSPCNIMRDRLISVKTSFPDIPFFTIDIDNEGNITLLKNKPVGAVPNIAIYCNAISKKGFAIAFEEQISDYLRDAKK